MTVVFYISGHGFGHASREIEVMHALAERHSGVRLIARTAIPSSFFEGSARVPVEVQHVQVDTGVTQIDSIRIDEDATAREAVAFYEAFDTRARDEARTLRQLDADLVVGDVPPLAFAAAALADLPSILLANFTWDWIYAAYPALGGSARAVLETIRRAHSMATTALRLPFSGGFEGIRSVRDLPLIARRSRHTREETRRRLGIRPDRLVVLASFGRYGMALPLQRVAGLDRFTLLTTDDDAASDPPPAAVVRLSGRDMTASDLRYEDLVASADVVVSKAGYGIVSECIANGAALLYTSRGRFVEHDVFVREMPAVLRCRPIDMNDFLQGHWWENIQSLLEQPAPTGDVPTDGAEAAAATISALAAPHSAHEPAR